MQETSDKIFDVLKTDAKLTTTGTLGALLGKSTDTTQKAYGIYCEYPDKTITPPYVVVKEMPATKDKEFGSKNGSIFYEAFDIAAIGDNFDAILDRIYKLLQGKSYALANDQIHKIDLDFISERLYDDELEVYMKKSRYNLSCWKHPA